jgi:hypothetical protein
LGGEVADNVFKIIGLGQASTAITKDALVDRDEI